MPHERGLAVELPQRQRHELEVCRGGGEHGALQHHGVGRAQRKQRRLLQRLERRRRRVARVERGDLGRPENLRRARVSRGAGEGSEAAARTMTEVSGTMKLPSSLRSNLTR
jgi:ribosomal protein L44E